MIAMHKTIRKSQRLAVARIVLAGGLVMQWLALSPAQADTRCKYSGPAIPTLQLHVQTFAAGSHVPVGTRLTPFATFESADLWHCIRQAPFADMFVHLRLNLHPTGDSHVEDGLSHAVFKTNLPGVGIVFRFAVWDGENWTTGTSALEAALMSPMMDVGPIRPLAPFSDDFLGIKLSAAFVKTGEDTTGSVDLSYPFLEVWVAANDEEGHLAPVKTTLRASGSPHFIDSTCEMQDINVALPSVSTRSLGEPGSTAGAVDFQLNLTNCPRGYSAIAYEMDAPFGLRLDSALGVLGLDASATATGLGVQVRTRADDPVPLGQRHAIEAYQSAVGGNVHIPLRAAYFQTSGTIGAGSVSSSAVVTLWYQ